MPTFAPELSAEQIGEFRERGFLALGAIAPPDEIAWLRDVYAELLEDRRALRLRYRENGPDGAERRIDHIFSPELQCARLLQSEYMQNARRLGARLLGCSLEEAKPGGLMMIYGLYPGVSLENAKALMDAMEKYATHYS